jgi:hypothetical protein
MMRMKFPLLVVAVFVFGVSQSGAADALSRVDAVEVGESGAAAAQVAAAPEPDLAVLFGAVGVMRILRRRR